MLLGLVLINSRELLVSLCSLRVCVWRLLSPQLHFLSLPFLSASQNTTPCFPGCLSGMVSAARPLRQATEKMNCCPGTPWWETPRLLLRTLGLPQWGVHVSAAIRGFLRWLLFLIYLVEGAKTSFLGENHLQPHWKQWVKKTNESNAWNLWKSQLVWL